VVLVNADAFIDSKPGQLGNVSATVICRVPLSDLVLPGTPGSRTLTATFTSPLDPFRGR
jgi:hypothetical protein